MLLVNLMNHLCLNFFYIIYVDDHVTLSDFVSIAHCSYLVCSMFEEATSLASSILKCIHDRGRSIVIKEEACDMLESTGMVLVQSLKELGRYLYFISTFVSFVVIKNGATIYNHNNPIFNARPLQELNFVR